jgi:multimeric flavodoxin WrbA
MKILAIVGSPRKGSNSTMLLEEFLRGAVAYGAQIQVIRPWQMQIAPCDARNACYTTGRCVIEDDYQSAYDSILAHDAIVLATPIYFGGVPAPVKLFIDRCQCFWAMRHILKAAIAPAPGGQPRKGVLLAVGGAEAPAMSAGVRLTFNSFMYSLQGETWGELVFRGYDEPGEIQRTPAALEQSFLLGQRFAQGWTPGSSA